MWPKSGCVPAVLGGAMVSLWVGCWRSLVPSVKSTECVEGVFSEVQGHSPKFEQKVTKKCVEALRDAYGDVLCLSACYREPCPGIHTTDVLASKHDQRSQDLGGGV